MPSRNTVREYSGDSFYHIYNRGVEKRIIFKDNQDYTVYLGLLKKYLTGEYVPVKNNRHKVLVLSDNIKLLAYCLMPNHFHLLVYQSSSDGVTRLMRGVNTSYSMYFNNRYSRVGTLYQGKFRAPLINGEAYLHHISRYIHLNPKSYKDWPYSSYKVYTGEKKMKWIDIDRVLELFNNATEYVNFIEDYVESKQELHEIRQQLAN